MIEIPSHSPVELMLLVEEELGKLTSFTSQTIQPDFQY